MRRSSSSASRNQPGKHEVLVVGAGPTGLALAYKLASYDVSVRVVERRATRTPSNESRGLVVHARACEILGRNLAKHMLEQGRGLNSIDVVAGGKQIAHVPLTGPGIGEVSPYQQITTLMQSEFEAIVEAQLLKEYGVAVDRQVRLKTLCNTEEGVDVTLVHEKDQEEVKDERVAYRYVVGCDGSGSTTRHALGMKVDRHLIPNSFLLADVKLTGDDVPDFNAETLWIAPTGVMGFIPLVKDQMYRVIIVVPPRARLHSDELTLDMVKVEIEKLCKRKFVGEIETYTWLSMFEVRQFVAPTFQVQRVFLAGDAAHAHSPLGGQGMNNSLSDSVNLAYRLAMVLRGHASEAMLAAFTEERRSVATALVKETGHGTRALGLRNRLLVTMRNIVIRTALNTAVGNVAFARKFMMLVINYRGGGGGRSTYCQGASRADRKHRLGPGARAPMQVSAVEALVDSRPRHIVLIFTGKAAVVAGSKTDKLLSQTLGKIVEAAGADAVDLVLVRARPDACVTAWTESSGVSVDDTQAALAVHAAFDVSRPGVVVVRPDTYIGFRAVPANPRALASWWLRRVKCSK